MACSQVQPKHVPCIGVSCLHIAAKMVEDECNISPTHELIRISQSKFTVSDLSRMEKIISEKLNLELKAITALTFLHLYHAVIVSLTSERWALCFSIDHFSRYAISDVFFQWLEAVK